MRPIASGSPLRSTIVPRDAGTTIVSRCCLSAMAAYSGPFTTWIHTARARAAPRRSKNAAASSGGSSPPASPGELEVGGVLGLDLVQAELAARQPLDPRRGRRTRDLGAQ